MRRVDYGVYVKRKVAWGSYETKSPYDIAVDDDGYNREGSLLWAEESSTKKVVLDIVIVGVFGHGHEMVGDQVLSCCACLFPWRLIFDVCVSTTNSVDIVIQSSTDLSCSRV